MEYKIGDNIVLKNTEFKEYNGKIFTIVDILLEGVYMVVRDGFDPIWVTEENFV